MYRPFILPLTLLATSAFATPALLYDNTATDTFNALFYSVGPYAGIGDQIRLTASGVGQSAAMQFFNAGAPGAFDVELRFFEVGAPVGAQIGGPFTRPGVTSTGMDVVDVLFDLGMLALPQDVIFVASVNAAQGMDVGVNLFEPPTIGSSDPTALIVDSGGFRQAFSSNENVYFQVTAAVPEPSTFGFAATALGAILVLRNRSRRPV